MKHKFIVTIDVERCKGCCLCVEICPHHVLGMSNAMNVKGLPYARSLSDECRGCLQCCDICPDAAIEIEKEAD